MNYTIRKALAPLSLIVAGVCFAGSAHAGCFSEALSKAAKMQKQSWHGGAVRMTKVDWHDEDMDPIVGFWNVVITAKGNGGGGPPDGAPLDGGVQHWHVDGTEFLNSAGQKPQTQNYCMGTWKRTGPRTYKVNHFGINYDLAQHYVGITRIQETVVLAHDGASFTGTFRADGYDKLRNSLGGVSAVLVGKRITIDTTAQEIAIPPAL